MSTVNDFIGKNCPLCGAEDSLETDEVMGEVACVNCAKVIAMGLEENVLTRFDKDATYADVDHATSWGESSDTAGGGHAVGAEGISREAAAARAAGVILKRVDDMNTEGGRQAKYAKTQLNPNMRKLIENLCLISRRNEDVKTTAMNIARSFVGYRREQGVKVEHINEVSAACFLLSTEIHEEPVPMAELRELNSDLKNVEMRRQEVVADTRMEERERQLRLAFPGNLLRRYIRMLHLQRSLYEGPCEKLLKAIRMVASTDVASLVESERVFAAVLLARTEPSITWEGRPVQDPSTEPPAATAYAAFASSARLPEEKVHSVMRVVRQHLPGIKENFAKLSVKRERSPES